MAKLKYTRLHMETGDILLLAAQANPGKDSNCLACFHNMGLVRFRAVEDESYSFEDLCGDMYSPHAHPGIPADKLAREKRAFRARVAREGVWGVVIDVRASCQDAWASLGPETVDSIWGLVGGEFFGSGYDGDMIRTALDWLEGAGLRNHDRQLALMLSATEAYRLLETIQAEQPDALMQLRDRGEFAHVMGELKGSLERYPNWFPQS